MRGTCPGVKAPVHLCQVCQPFEASSDAQMIEEMWWAEGQGLIGYYTSSKPQLESPLILERGGGGVEVG